MREYQPVASNVRERAPQPPIVAAMHARFVGALDALGIVPGSRVLVAISGGADSVALLRLFCALRDVRGLSIHAAHLHHGMRGEAADQDAAFVRSLCEALQVPCILGAVDVPALAAKAKTGPEDAARQARYAFLERARAQSGADWIALAHHLEDQAETLLLHMTRGCGLAGLCGMRAMRGAHVRPLLGEHRQALRDYLQSIGQPWREDASNADPAYARNLLRTQVIPAWTQLNPSLAETLAALAERLAVDEACLCQQACAFPPAKPMPYGACLPIELLCAAHEAIRRRVLMQAWESRCASPPATFAAKVQGDRKALVARESEISIQIEREASAAKVQGDRKALVARESEISSFESGDVSCLRARPGGFPVAPWTPSGPTARLDGIHVGEAGGVQPARMDGMHVGEAGGVQPARVDGMHAGEVGGSQPTQIDGIQSGDGCVVLPVSGKTQSMGGVGLQGAIQQLSFHHIAALSALLDAPSGRTCNLPGDWHALRGKRHLHLIAPERATDPHDPTDPRDSRDMIDPTDPRNPRNPREPNRLPDASNEAIPLRLSGETRWAGGALMARAALPGELGDGVRTQVLDGDALERLAPVVRCRRAGDRFRPLGASGSQPLKQTLMDRGVDRPFRALLPMIAAGDRALWLIGHLPAQDAAVTAHTTRPIHFTFEGELPWE